MSILIDGKTVSAKIKNKLTKEVESLKKAGITPSLTVLMVGNDPASSVYVKNKARAASEIGILSDTIILPEKTSQEELLELIEKLNLDVSVHGILVQLPIPKHIDEKAIIESISPEKDVDGFHPINVGMLASGNPHFTPCTPAGIMELLKHYNIDIDGKNCVVLGRSNIVGKPTALILLANHGTVTIVHSHTADLANITKQADILIAAIGNPQMIKSDMIKEGVVLIDVGINRVDGKLVGDIDFAGCQEKASAITPVPGGVGLMTVTMLIKNTIQAAKEQN